MLEVLERAADDINFRWQLAEGDPKVVLKDFNLTSEERAPLHVADAWFIESRTRKKLDEKIMEKVIIWMLSRCYG